MASNFHSVRTFTDIVETQGDSTLGGRRKRVFDLVMVTLSLPLLLPILGLVALTIKFRCGGNVLFRQSRIGQNGETFECLKFRTMVPNAEAKLLELIETDPEARAEYEKTHKLKKDPRILPVIGNFLRKSSLDELPQFFNVLRDEMSIVGPRPVMEAEFNILDEHHASAYKSARPGITGRWQVSGRNELDFSARADLDVDYVRNWSFFRDLKIIFSTVGVLVMCKGAY